MKYIMLEHHPNDSRLKITEDGICQTLNQRMGTGGGNVPLVLAIEDEDNCSGIKSESCNDNRKWHMPDSSGINGAWRGLCADGISNR